MDGRVSECCGAPAVEQSEDLGLCPECKEHCEYVEDNDPQDAYLFLLEVFYPERGKGDE